MFSQVCLSACLILTGCSPTDDGQGPEPLAGHTVEHHTTHTPPEPGPVPTTVTETAWTWEANPDTTIQAIHPTPTGALIHLNNGLVGMDTTTGEPAWSYLLPHSTDLDQDETDLALTPDTTMAAFSPGQTTVLLDTATGQEHQRLDHHTQGPDQFTPTRLGLPHTQGNLTAGADHDLHLTLTPWNHQNQNQNQEQDQNQEQEQNQEQGQAPVWESTLPACQDGERATIDQGLLTHDHAVIVHRCPTQEPTLTGIDLDTGEQAWRLQQGQDYQPDEDEVMSYLPSGQEGPEFTVVGDLLVLENISLQRGTVVIDTTTGEPITDELSDDSGNIQLRVLSDGYLALNTTEIPDQDEKERIYELREFDDTVRHSVEPEGPAGVTNSDFLPLEDSLLKPRTTEDREKTTMVVMDWDTGEERHIPLPIDATTLDIMNLFRADNALGPDTFLEVPGAVLIREYPQGRTPRLAALR